MYTSKYLTSDFVLNALSVIEHESHRKIIVNMADWLKTVSPSSAIEYAADDTTYKDAMAVSEAYQLLADIAQAVADKTKVELPI